MSNLNLIQFRTPTNRTRKIIEQAAKKSGESLSGYILKAVRRAIEADGIEFKGWMCKDCGGEWDLKETGSMTCGKCGSYRTQFHFPPDNIYG